MNNNHTFNITAQVLRSLRMAMNFLATAKIRILCGGAWLFPAYFVAHRLGHWSGACVFALAFSLFAAGAFAQSTWQLGSGQWGVTGNWSPSGVPNGQDVSVIFDNNINNANRTVTVNGAFTVGSLLINGINGANTYAGDTIVSAGTLELGNALALGGVADLSVWAGAAVNLNYSGTATIDSLLLDNVTISNLTIGQSYTSAELNTALSASIFSGGGLLSISTIPEPSTWVLLLTGAALVAVCRRVIV
ncbi:MAG: PEP-CTERM sorting domain-containing protein [Verrucomicrobiales bacterium]|jgi:autotransporter-associated beta strand protein|nr:PEP-CTERM sorting domain-containing protein [Verrucomicrobiales bacterium]